MASLSPLFSAQLVLHLAPLSPIAKENALEAVAEVFPKPWRSPHSEDDEHPYAIGVTDNVYINRWQDPLSTTTAKQSPGRDDILITINQPDRKTKDLDSTRTFKRPDALFEAIKQAYKDNRVFPGRTFPQDYYDYYSTNGRFALAKGPSKDHFLPDFFMAVELPQNASEYQYMIFHNSVFDKTPAGFIKPNNNGRSLTLDQFHNDLSQQKLVQFKQAFDQSFNTLYLTTDYNQPIKLSEYLEQAKS